MPENSAEKKSGFSAMRDNPWMISTFVLGVLFLIALFVATTGTGVSGNVVSENEASQKVLTALNAQTGGGVTLNSIKKEGGLYKVMVSYQGDNVPVYATLDGTKLAFNVVALDGSAQPTPSLDQPSAAPSGSVEIDAAKIANAPVKGSADALITIVEFSDYQCPFCERFYSGALPQIDEQYIKTGKVNLIYMDFPLGFHDQAQKAAESTRCVRKQKGDEGYWNMHDKLFENQASLSEANFKQWARDVGANGAQFDACLDSGEFADEVQADLDYGSSLGVSGTPAFFVNGVELVGAQPFVAFKQIIDAELAKVSA